MSTEHDPLPWRIEDRGVIAANNQYVCSNGRDGNVEEFVTRGQSNMRFIVRACNCHDELLAGCKLALEEYLYDDCHDDCGRCTPCRIRAAILKAKGGGA